MKLLLLLVALVAVSGNILLEVDFDLALQQESETGYTASHTVEEYLKSPNLVYLRYLNTLVSGAPGRTPMRTAMLEFKDYAGWAAFETAAMERTHILYDLFWINWRRVMWESVDSLTLTNGERTESNAGGYMFVFRYSIKAGQEKHLADKMKTLPSLEGSEGFLERRAYTNGVWQSEYSHMMWYEFNSLEHLTKAVYDSSPLMKILEEAKAHMFDAYTTTIMTPSAGGQGVLFFKGGMTEEQK